MARAMGRSIETEQRYAHARLRRIYGPDIAGASIIPPEHDGRGILGALAAAAEMTVIVMVALMLSAATLHVVRPEASCASCTTERR